MSLPSFAATELFGLKGAVALVTGGGTGIGLYASRALAANGARVFITGRREEKLKDAAEVHGRGLEGELIPIQLDVTNKEDLIKVAKDIQQREGKLHILINNAGIAGPKTKFESEIKGAQEYSSKHLESEDFESWSSLFTTNVSSVFFTSMAFLPLLEAGLKAPHRPGFTPAIVNITSISGIVKTAQNHFAYNASKAAASHLTQMLSHELNYGHKAVPGIRVNAIAPGLFPSEMTGPASEKGGVVSPDSIQMKPANGRVGTPAEMASAILFASTNTFLQGQIIPVDGGWTTAVASSA